LKGCDKLSPAAFVVQSLMHRNYRHWSSFISYKFSKLVYDLLKIYEGLIEILKSDLQYC